MAKIRIKCPFCGEVSNVPMGSNICPACKKPVEIQTDTCIYIYRQGSPYGVAGGFGIYINGVAYGYIGNKETLCFPLPYGTYNLHCAVGMGRKCLDLVVKLSPENPRGYAKVHINMGFWANTFAVEPIVPELIASELIHSTTETQVKAEVAESENTVTCPACGNVAVKGNFCIKCGHKFESKCPGCGAELADGAKFCAQCGIKL